MESTSADLPDYLGSVLTKELRQNLRRASFIYPFLLIHLFAIIAVVADFELGSFSTPSISPSLFSWSGWNVGYLWWLALITCAVILPISGFFSIAQEVTEGNHELLQLTQLGRWNIIFGKFLTLWSLCILTFISLLPYFIIRYFIGGIEWLHEFANAGTLSLLSALACSVTISSSGFATIGSRFGVCLLHVFTSLIAPIVSTALTMVWISQSNELIGTITAQIVHHLVCLLIFGSLIFLFLTVARSRIRVATMNYETKPSSIILILIGSILVSTIFCWVITPFLVPIMALTAYFLDRSPKAPKSKKAPPLNIPKMTNNASS